MKRINVEEWRPFGDITLEDNAEYAIRYSKNIAVIAGPGAGKTELLAQKAGFLLATNSCVSPKKILAISFKKDAAANLFDRVFERCGNVAKDRFASMTYDAFFKMVFDRFRMALPEEYRPPLDYEINNDDAILAAFKGLNSVNREITIKDCHALLRNVNILPVDNSLKIVWERLIHGHNGYKATLTFPIINLLAEYIVRTNIKIKRAICSTYSHVFLDEFQDTTDLQYDFIVSCFKDTNIVVTAVGDVKQRIMVWAGAKKGVFRDFLCDFKAEYRKLKMNHRSAPRLVELQKQMYQSLQDKTANIMCSKRWNAGDGNAALYITDDENAEAKIVGDDIIRKLESGIKCKDICLLVKQKADSYTAKIIKYLNEQGVSARVEVEYQDLLKEPVVDIILAILQLSYDRHNSDCYESIMSWLNELNICRVDGENGAFFSAIDNLYKLLDSIKEQMNENVTTEKLMGVIDKIIDFIGVDILKKYVPAYSQGDFLKKTIEKFKCLVGREITPNCILSDIVNGFMGTNSIAAMTIHKSKGLEYEVVYFIGLEDEAFWNFGKQPEEDRCAFFVAISRAKQHLIFTFCKEREWTFKRYQSRQKINEFYELFNSSNIVSVYNFNRLD